MKRKKVWFMGLAMLVAMILIFDADKPSTATLNLPAQAEGMPEMLAGRSGNQSLSSPFLKPPPPPKPSISAVTESSMEAAESSTEAAESSTEAAESSTEATESSTEAKETPQAEPSPEPSEKATDKPKPEETPNSSEESTQEASPEPTVPVAPAIAPNNSSETISAATLPLSETPYKDPQGRFEVGIVENYNVSAIADSPLIESPDGNMAYTVVLQPKITNEQFSNEALAQIAMNQFQRGEGFQAEPLQILENGEILIPWTGTVTIGRRPQPISGSILVRQNTDKILILLVSATENASQDISSAIATLSDSLKFL
jgi:outer membrane biosynthesis protein TonB